MKPNKYLRFIYLKKDQRKIHKKQSLQDFNKAFAKGKFWYIKPVIPSDGSKKEFLDSLKKAHQRLCMARDAEIAEATRKINTKYSHKIETIEKPIKKMEALMFLKHEYNMVMQVNAEASPTS